MITNETITYRDKEYKVITVDNAVFSASFANTLLYDELFTDYNDGDTPNDDYHEVWDEIYYFTDLVDQYNDVEFVRTLFQENPEIKEIYQNL